MKRFDNLYCFAKTIKMPLDFVFERHFYFFFGYLMNGARINRSGSNTILNAVLMIHPITKKISAKIFLTSQVAIAIVKIDAITEMIIGLNSNILFSSYKQLLILYKDNMEEKPRIVTNLLWSNLI
jgi:hypothetical protein